MLYIWAPWIQDKNKFSHEILFIHEIKHLHVINENIYIVHY